MATRASGGGRPPRSVEQYLGSMHSGRANADAPTARNAPGYYMELAARVTAGDHATLQAEIAAELRANPMLVGVPRARQSVGPFPEDQDVDVFAWREGDGWQVAANPFGVPIFVVNGKLAVDARRNDDFEELPRSDEELTALARARAERGLPRTPLPPEQAADAARGRWFARLVSQHGRHLENTVGALIAAGAHAFLADPGAVLQPVSVPEFARRHLLTEEGLEALAWKRSVRCEHGTYPLARFVQLRY